MGEFVVGVNRAVVQRARERTLRWSMVSAVSALASAALFAVLGVLLIWLAGPIGALEFASVLVFGYSGVHRLRAIARLRREWASSEIVDVAMRLSTAGVRMSVGGAPDRVFLPWPVIEGFHLHHWRGKQLLVVDLLPQVDAGTPGVEGLQHPAVQRMLHQRVHGTTGLHTSAGILDQPPEAIDAAASSFTAGRVRVR